MILLLHHSKPTKQAMASIAEVADALPHLHLAVLGHAQSGKSSVLGRLLAELGSLPASEMDRIKLDGHGNVKYAAVWDRLECERQRDMTLDLHDRPCQTKKFRWTVVDVPGHRRYLRNTLTGLSCADLVLLVVDATPGTFETHMEDNALEEGVNAQTKEHLMLLFALGVKQVVVVVNKMDACGYKQERFEMLCVELSSQMKKLNLAPEQTRFVPVSAASGENITHPSKVHMPWFSGSTLLEALDASTPPARLLDKPLRMPVQQVHKISGIGCVVCGKVEAGSIAEGSKVVLAPQGIIATVKSIETQQMTVDQASAGDSVGISLKGVSIEEVCRGMVVLPYEGNGQLIQVPSFQATVSIRRPQGISVGYVALLDVHCAHVPCRFSRLIAKLDKKTGKVAETSPTKLADRDVGTVEVVPLCPLFVDSQKDVPALGRFVVQHRHQIVALGVVKSVEMCAVQCRQGSLLVHAKGGVEDVQ